MLKFILAPLLIAICCAVTFLFDLSIWFAVVPTFLVVMAFVVSAGYAKYRSIKSARDIEQALRQQADAHSDLVRPDEQAEIDAMKEEFDQAISVLKSSKLARGGAAALSALPWYVIIGPPGAGKTTALMNSGLRFPHMGSSGRGVRGVGGTRNCEWFLTNEAVLVDTAGRYATEDDDRNEWLAFLDMLRRTRSRKPINGIIVAVSVTDLVDASTADVDLAKKLRQRVDETLGRLKMVLPVYLMVTKCDLIPGFVETFGDLKKAERGQVFGFTLPMNERPTNLDEVVQERFTTLSAALERQTIDRLGQERRLDARQAIYSFPQAFEDLRTPIVELLGPLFEVNVYQDTPIMRGLYFTSGTQEGRPIDRVMEEMARSFGVRGGVDLPEQTVDHKSYFLLGVFKRVILPDRDLASQSDVELRRRRNMRIAVAVSALVLAGLIAILPGISFKKNKQLLDQTEALVTTSPAEGKASIEHLDQLRAKVAELTEYQDEPPMAFRFGLYQGEKIRPRLTEFFAQEFGRLRVDPALSAERDKLSVFGRHYDAIRARPTPDEHGEFYDRLRFYLLMTQPKEPGEPRLNKAEQAWLGDELTVRLATGLDPERDSPTIRRIQTNAVFFAQLLASRPELSSERDPAVVTKVRAALTRIPLSELALRQIIKETKIGGYNLTLAHLIGGTGSAFKSDATVREAFTRRGWEEVVRDRLGSSMDSFEPWVVGHTIADLDDAKKAQQLAEVRSEYFRQYIEEWRKLVDSVHLDWPESTDQALSILRDLSGGTPPPLARLMEQVSYNTTLLAAGSAVDSESADAAKDVIKAGLLARIRGRGSDKLKKVIKKKTAKSDTDSLLFEAEDVAAAFKGFVDFGVAPKPVREDAPPIKLPINVYQEQLIYVADALQAHLDSPGEGSALLRKLQTARTRVRSLIEAQEIGWRPRFDKILWPPIDGASQSSTGSLAAMTGGRWCSAVATPFSRLLRRKYPFRRKGNDAALADVAEFYRPDDGVLWSFYSTMLEQRVVRVGDKFEVKASLGDSSGKSFSSSLLKFLRRSADLSSVLFPSNAKELKIDFELRVRPSPHVNSTSLTIDGKTITYQNGPEEWHAFSWPGAGGAHGARLHAVGNKGEDTIRQDGEWGLFRLLEAGKVKASSGRAFQVTWKLKTQKATVSLDFRPARSETPFFGVRRGSRKPKFMAPFRSSGVLAPSRIAKGGPPCPTSGG